MLPRAVSLLLVALVGLLTFGAAPASATNAFGDINNPSLVSLNTGNFTSSLSRGAWLVEFYSPYCKHCKKFAPVWQDVVEYSDHLADESNFRFARVNCITQGDICEEQKIRGFPEMFLWMDGVQIEEYSGEREFDDIYAYVEARAAEYGEYRNKIRALDQLAR